MWGKPKQVAPQPSVRRKRVALLNAEADVQRNAAEERARSVQNKASFLVVAAGFLAGSTFAAPTDIFWLLQILPLVAALGAVILSAIALWPANQDAINPRKLKDEWIDSPESDYALEIFLLQCKIVAYEEIQTRTNSRVKALKAGFVLLAVAVAATLASVSVSSFT